MRRLIAVGLASALAACAPTIGYYKPGATWQEEAAARSDCEHKTRQVSYSFGPYDGHSVLRFYVMCMAGHGFEAHVQ